MLILGGGRRCKHWPPGAGDPRHATDLVYLSDTASCPGLFVQDLYIIIMPILLILKRRKRRRSDHICVYLERS